MFEAFAALAAKIATTSTLVQATAGLGIAVAGVTGAGAAGVLPGPLQDGVASAVEAVSPFELPSSTGETQDSGVDGPGDVPGADPTDIATPSSSPAPGTTEADEPGDDDGVHQNRGGAPTPTAAVRTDNSGPGSANSGRDDEDSDSAGATSGPSDSPEVEDHDDSDHSGHGGGDDDSSGDSSGHGGGDDD